MPGSTGGTQHKREFTTDTTRTRCSAAQRPTNNQNNCQQQKQQQKPTQRFLITF